MTSCVIDLRLRKIEKRQGATMYDRMSEAELNDLINRDLATVCEGYASVNAAADAFRVSNDLEDRLLAEQLDWYIADVIRERGAGRMQ